MTIAATAYNSSAATRVSSTVVSWATEVRLNRIMIEVINPATSSVARNIPPRMILFLVLIVIGRLCNEYNSIVEGAKDLNKKIDICREEL